MASAWCLLQYLIQMSIVFQAAMSAHNYLPLIRNTKSVSVVELIHLSSPPTALEERLVRVTWTNTYSVNEYQSTFIKALLFTVNEYQSTFIKALLITSLIEIKLQPRTILCHITSHHKCIGLILVVSKTSSVLLFHYHYFYIYMNANYY